MATTEARAERTKPPEAQAENAWQQFAQELLVLNHNTAEAERTDAAATRVKLIQSGWDILKPHVLLRRLDTRWRGRDAGPMVDRTARMFADLTVGAVFTGIDLLDAGFETANLTPVTAALAAGWEYMSDTALDGFANWMGRKATGIENFEYASRFSKWLSRGINLVPVVRQFVDSVNTESVFRAFGEVPILGIPVERAYEWGNQYVDNLSKDAQGKWYEGLILAMGGGYAKKRWQTNPAPAEAGA